MSMNFEAGMKRLLTFPDITQEELNKISEGILAMAKHDGILDARQPGTGSHAECRLVPPGMAIEIEDVVGQTVYHSYLEASQALSLLAWLRQEEDTLKRLAKEHEDSAKP